MFYIYFITLGDTMDDCAGDRNIHLLVFLRGFTHHSHIVWFDSSGNITMIRKLDFKHAYLSGYPPRAAV